MRECTVRNDKPKCVNCEHLVLGFRVISVTQRWMQLIVLCCSRRLGIEQHSSTMNDAEFEYIRMCHMNCQSLHVHLDEFRHFFNNSGFHLICMSETWLRPEIVDNLVSLPGYKLYRCDREGRQGGSVAFYLAKLELHASVLCSSAVSLAGRPEFLIAEISVQGSSKLLMAVVYRPPLDIWANSFKRTQISKQATGTQ